MLNGVYRYKSYVIDVEAALLLCIEDQHRETLAYSKHSSAESKLMKGGTHHDKKPIQAQGIPFR